MKKRSRLFIELFKDLENENSGFHENKMLLIFKISSKRSKHFITQDFDLKKISIRKAETKDFDGLFELDNLCFGSEDNKVFDEYKESSTNEEVGITASEDPNREIELAEIDGATYIAEIEGNLIGKVDTLTQDKDGYIYGFCITSEFRRKGYGHIMAWLLLKEFIKNGVSSVLLEVAKENTAAIELYKKCGFIEITRKDLI